MKKATFTIIILLCVSLVSAQENDNHVKLDFQTAYFTNPSFVNGKLKEINQISYKAKLVDGEVLKGEKIQWKHSNKTTVHARYLFAESGQIIQKLSYDDSGNSINNIVLNYDHNNLQKVFYIKKDTLIQINEIISKDNKIHQIKFLDVLTPTIYGVSKYSYDQNGFMVKQENFNADGDRTMEVNWERDNKGRIETYESKNGQGGIIYSGYCEYDDSWEPSAIVSQYSGGKKVNNVLKKEYEFDENGNWTKLISYRNDEPESITFRTFKFYIDRTEIELPESLLNKYVGKYELQAGIFIVISKVGKNMYGEVGGQEKFEIFAYEKRKFFLKEVPAHLEFHVNTDGSVTGLTFVQGQEIHATKIE